MEPSTHAEIKHRSIRAVKWSVLGELLIRTIQPLILLVLARLLSPADFGVVGVATITIGIGQIFQEFGAGKALVQTSGNIETHANNAFWINTAVASAIYGLIFVFAEPIAAFFQSPGSAPVLRVLGIQIVLSGFMSVQAAVLQRAVRFRALFLVRLLPALVTGTLSISLAFRGDGVWALVWGTLAGSILQVLLYWRSSTWRPRLQFEWQEFRRMFAFSRWVMIEALLAWLISWGDSIALGHFLGPEVLGLYRMGTVAIAYLSNIVFTPLVPITLSLLSRLQGDRVVFVDCLGKLTRIIALLTLPLGAGIFLLGQPATLLVLGPKWADAGIVVQLMGLRMAIGWLVGLHSTAFTAFGRPDINVMSLLIATVIALPVYFFTAPHGILVFCWARLLAAQLDNLVNHAFARLILSLPSSYLWSRVRVPLLATLLMAATLGTVIHWQPATNVILLSGMVLSGFGGYMLFLRLLDQQVFAWGWRAARQVIARKPAAFFSA